NTAKRKFGSHEEIEKTVREVLQEQFPQKVIFTPIYSTKELSDFNINVIKQRLGTDYELDVFIGLHYFSLLNNTLTKKEISFKNTTISRFRIYEIASVVSHNKAGLKDALNFVGNSTFTIKPGENKIFVVNTFENSSYTDLQSGSSIQNNKFLSQIILTKCSNPTRNTHNRLSAVTWAYLDKAVVKDNVDYVVNDLEKAGVDVIVVHSGFIDGFDTKDFSKLKSYLSRFKNLKNKKLFLFHNFNTGAVRKFNGKTFMDSAWRENFKNWYSLLKRELTRIGINSNNIYYYPFDEIKPEQVDHFVKLSKWGKKYIDNFRLFLTLNDQKSYLAAEFADIVQIPHSHLRNLSKISNDNIWLYSADNRSRELDPYNYYRLKSWIAYYYGLTGVGFWNYASLPSKMDAYYNKAVNFNKEYSVIYLDEGDNVIPSLRWMNFQQGLYDYKLLSGYEKVLGKDKVKSLVEAVVENPNDAGKADEVLRKLAAMI